MYSFYLNIKGDKDNNKLKLGELPKEETKL